jgi:hypothetical protein
MLFINLNLLHILILASKNISMCVSLFCYRFNPCSAFLSSFFPEEHKRQSNVKDSSTTRPKTRKLSCPNHHCPVTNNCHLNHNQRHPYQHQHNHHQLQDIITSNGNNINIYHKRKDNILCTTNGRKVFRRTKKCYHLLY